MQKELKAIKGVVEPTIKAIMFVKLVIVIELPAPA